MTLSVGAKGEVGMILLFETRDTGIVEVCPSEEAGDVTDNILDILRLRC